ncbi:MAG: hypothetical protein K2N18_00930, partial [Clostridia bacterium]|nr:hypothetical protein [Clostridia bacterium]
NLNKEAPNFASLIKDAADGGDFDLATAMDTAVTCINTAVAIAGIVCSSFGPYGQMASAALSLVESVIKLILGGQDATSEIAQVEDRLNQQFDDVKEQLTGIEEKVNGLSNQINASTNKIISAMSTALDNADAKQQLRTFMLGGEGNFSYNQYRNYIYGTATNNSKADTAYYGLLKQHLINGSSDEIVKYYYDELYTAIKDNKDAYYDYIVADNSGKSIMQYYYDVVSARPDLMDASGTTAELMAVQFAYDLYLTELMADQIILSCNTYQYLQMRLEDSDVYELNSGEIVTKASIEGSNSIDSMYDQIQLRKAEITERFAKDLSYILNLDGSYTVEETSGDVYQIV